MAEVVAALVLGSSIISFIDMGGKVITRVQEYIETSQEVPEVLRDISDRLETLLLTTKNLELALNAGKLDDGARAALKSTVAGLERQALILQGLCEHMLPSLGDMWWQKARKAVSSLRKEKELKNVLQKIIAYESTLNLYFTTAISLKDSSSVPWTQRTYHDVPPFAFGRCIGRRRILDQVAASFRMDKLEPRMTTVLLGIGGQGKTMIAREYCRRQRDHISLFWIDASSYPTALSGMQRASQLVNSSTESDPSSHMQRLPASQLEKLLHPFLIVLDNMDHAKDFTQIMQLMPGNKMCMVLITSRHRDAQQLGTCIEINPMEQEEAVELLLTKCNITSDLEHHAHAESIVKTLAHLPLAIDQAGAYISSRNLPLEQFIDHFNIRKEVIMNYIPSGWPYQKAHDGQQCVSDLCVFTTWELSIDELGSSVDAEPFIDLLTFAAFVGPSHLLAKMLKTQVEENLAADLGCRNLYTSEGGWDPWKYQDTIVQLYSVSLISEIDMSSAETEFVIHPLVKEWLQIRAGDPKDKIYIEANTVLIHRICDRHNERVENFYVYERQVLFGGIVICAAHNRWSVVPTLVTRITKYSEVFKLALPSFVRFFVDCGEPGAAIKFMTLIHHYMNSELGFMVPADLLPRFYCEILCAEASMAVCDSEWRESHRISGSSQSLSDLNRMLEGGIFKELRPDERCVHRLKLLYGQVCIALGKIEAARQLLTDGFATSRQTFGTGDVLTMEFQTRLAEVYIERGEFNLAIAYLNPLTATRSGRSGFCNITARALTTKLIYMGGSLVEAETLLLKYLDEAAAIVGRAHSMIWRMYYDLAEVYLRQEDFSTAEVVLRSLRDLKIKDVGPEHLEVLLMTLDLARLKIATGETEEAGQICQALLVLQQKRDADTHDLINLTKAVLWLSDRHKGRIDSGRIDSENGLEIDLLKSLESGAIPNPQLARKWDMVARLAKYRGAVDVASVLKKHCDKATELAFGIEYLQAMEQDDASLEDSNNGLVAGTEASANHALRVERSIFHVWNA